MKKRFYVAIALALLSVSASAIGKKEVRAIIEEAYPGAKITEIEKEKYKGKKIYEVDFKHDGQVEHPSDSPELRARRTPPPADSSSSCKPPPHA